jgi:hypothetical protein
LFVWPTARPPPPLRRGLGARARRPAELLSRRDLLSELDAFYLYHRRCGDLDAAVDGATVWFACECGASMARRADDRDASLDVNT